LTKQDTRHKSLSATISIHRAAAGIFDTLEDYGQNTSVVVRLAIADIHSFVLVERPRTLLQSYNLANSKTNNNTLI
jgi:hypothetical protein